MIPLLDVTGRAASTSPEQIGATAVNVGVIRGSTVTDVVAVTPAQPAAGATT